MLGFTQPLHDSVIMGEGEQARVEPEEGAGKPQEF